MNENVSSTVCNPVNNLVENAKYLGQVAYMAPTAIIQARILYLLLFKYRKNYSESFYFIYSVSVILSFILINMEMFLNRLLLYIPQVCEPMAEFLNTYYIIPYFSFVIYRYLQFCQPLLEALLSLNRMSCALIPLTYSNFWFGHMKLILFSTFILPIPLLWHPLITGRFMQPMFGGIYINYVHKYDGGSTTIYAVYIRIITLSVMFFATIITLFKMFGLSKRVVRSERKLCITQILMSACFVITTVAEICFAVFRYASGDINLAVMQLSWDVINVIPCYIMLSTNPSLRAHILNRKGNVTKISVSSTHFSGTTLFSKRNK